MYDVIPQAVAPLESEIGQDDPYDIQVGVIYYQDYYLVKFPQSL